MKRMLLMLALVLTAIPVWAYTYKPPHGGILVELGRQEAFVELVYDAAEGSLLLYSLDENAETRVLLEQNQIVVHIISNSGAPRSIVPLKALEDRYTGETLGNTSTFKGQSEELKGLALGFSGVVVSVNSKGRNFRDVPFQFPPNWSPSYGIGPSPTASPSAAN